MQFVGRFNYYFKRNNKKQFEFHFNHYKDLKKPGTTHVKGFFGVDEAKTVIKEAIERWNKK